MMMAAPYAIAAALPRPALPAPPTLATLPAWHSLLEERWQQRLSTLTELALAYHDAAESCGHPAGAAETARLQRLLREATAARRALGETEDTLARLADGSFGRCEQCSRLIPSAELLAEPETRYCPDCVAVSWVTLAG
jgi:RNA polymerase-binding transcription factor DksA